MRPIMYDELRLLRFFLLVEGQVLVYVNSSLNGIIMYILYPHCY